MASSAAFEFESSYNELAAETDRNFKFAALVC